MAYVVIWCDLIGRIHIKSYVYRRCAEKFAVSLLLNSRAADDDVRVVTFDGRRAVKTSKSRVSDCSTWNILRGVI